MIQIPTSSYLRENVQEMDLEKFRHLSLGAKKTNALINKEQDDLKSTMNDAVNNLAYLSDGICKEVHNLYGGEGLNRIFLIAVSQDRRSFESYYDNLLCARFAKDVSEIVKNDQRALVFLRNKYWSQNRLSQFRLNITDPVVSQFLYRPGRHEASITAGLGGPRILVSMPFLRDPEWTSPREAEILNTHNLLAAKGIFGLIRCHYFSSKLEAKKIDTPLWLLWFSLVASHSDLVLFLKSKEDGFTRNQDLEISMLPSYLNYAVIECSNEELCLIREEKPTEIDGAFEVGSLVDNERALEDADPSDTLRLIDHFITEFKGVSTNLHYVSKIDSIATHEALNFNFYSNS